MSKNIYFLFANKVKGLCLLLMQNDIEKLTTALSVYCRESRKLGLKFS